MVRAMIDWKKTGENSVDFSLQDQNGKTFRLSEHLGKRVLLSFHPLAWTSVCAKQMRSLEDNKANFSSLDSIAVGISVDSVPCKKAWAESLGIVDTPPPRRLLASRGSGTAIRHFERKRRIFGEG
jgi:peroxiredoxin